MTLIGALFITTTIIMGSLFWKEITFDRIMGSVNYRAASSRGLPRED
jgi:hypothetical protein